MKRLFTFFTVWMILTGGMKAQHTFSIVAVDTATGEVGSAGASCITGFQVKIIAYLLPGTGAINTQAWWQFPNKNYGIGLMNNGHSPQEIIDSLSTNDRGSDGRDERWRQYGVADLFNGGARTAAWTGDSADDWKGHILGPNYAIQGNILIGQHVLDSMEARFLNTPGELADKLMAALQGANIPGADVRCLSDSTSSTSAYIMVAKPNDVQGQFYLDIGIPPLPAGTEPIDSLQVRYDEWKALTGFPDPATAGLYELFPVPAQDKLWLRSTHQLTGNFRFELMDISGKVVLAQPGVALGTTEIQVADLPGGMYLYRISRSGKAVQAGKVLLR